MNQDRLGHTLRLNEAAQLLGYESPRSLKNLRDRGQLLEGVHWRRQGVNRVIYYSHPLHHFRGNDWSAHIQWVVNNFSDVPSVQQLQEAA